MTNIYTLQNSLDPLLHRALSNVVAAANSIQIDYFIAGATARDIVLHGIFGYAPKIGRASCRERVSSPV